MTRLEQEMKKLGVTRALKPSHQGPKLQCNVDFKQGVVNKKIVSLQGNIVQEWKESYSVDEKGRVFMIPQFG